MYAKDPCVVSRQQEMKNLLVSGVSISEVATRVDLSKKRVYSFANSRSLPYNRPVKPGGRKEAQILRMIALGHNFETVGEAFNMAPRAVESVLLSAGYAEKVLHNPGHAREATPVASQEDGDVR